MKHPTIERHVDHPRDDRPGLLVLTPYDSRLVIDLKNIEPRRDRHWDAENFQQEGWWVAAEHEDDVVELCLMYFGGVQIIDSLAGDEFRGPGGERLAQDRLAL